MNARDILERVPSITRSDLYRYEAKGYIKPTKKTIGRATRNDYSDRDAELARLIKYYEMTGSSEGRTLDKAYQMALADMGKGLADVLRRY